MSDTVSFERQLGDVVWLISQALRAGYSVRQCFEHLASLDVEPTSSVFKGLVADLQAGHSIDEAFVTLLEAWPSPHLKRIIDVMLEQRKTSGNLAFMLDPFTADILADVNTDGALYPEMRVLAGQIGAELPGRVKAA